MCCHLTGKFAARSGSFFGLDCRSTRHVPDPISCRSGAALGQIKIKIKCAFRTLTVFDGAERAVTESNQDLGFFCVSRLPSADLRVGPAA